MEISKESSTAEKKRRRRKRGTREREKRERKRVTASKKLGPFLYMCFGLFAANDLAKIKHHY